MQHKKIRFGGVGAACTVAWVPHGVQQGLHLNEYRWTWLPGFIGWPCLHIGRWARAACRFAAYRLAANGNTLTAIHSKKISDEISVPIEGLFLSRTYPFQISAEMLLSAFLTVKTTHPFQGVVNLFWVWNKNGGSTYFVYCSRVTYFQLNQSEALTET